MWLLFRWCIFLSCLSPCLYLDVILFYVNIKSYDFVGNIMCEFFFIGWNWTKTKEKTKGKF